MHALNAGVNPLSGAINLGAKGLVILGLVLVGGAVFVIVRHMIKESNK